MQDGLTNSTYQLGMSWANRMQNCSETDSMPDISYSSYLCWWFYVNTCIGLSINFQRNISSYIFILFENTSIHVHPLLRSLKEGSLQLDSVILPFIYVWNGRESGIPTVLLSRALKRNTVSARSLVFLWWSANACFGLWSVVVTHIYDPLLGCWSFDL